MTKICSKCKVEKELSRFSWKDKSKGRLRSACRDCQKNYLRGYYESHKKEAAARAKISRELHKEELSAKDKKRYIVNRDNKLLYQKNYSQIHKEEISAYKKKYKQENKEKILTYKKEKIKTDLQYRLARNLRSRLRSAIKNNQKSGSAVKDLGCSIQELRAHLESKFQPGMSWDNYGLYGWHIDHIQPLASFDLEDREQFLKSNHFTNLQPLWAEDNLKKGNKAA